jgi:YD repeat-containing protein
VRIATDPDGRQVRFTYDVGGRVVREERQNRKRSAGAALRDEVKFGHG